MNRFKRKKSDQLERELSRVAEDVMQMTTLLEVALSRLEASWDEMSEEKRAELVSAVLLANGKLLQARLLMSVLNFDYVFEQVLEDLPDGDMKARFEMLQHMVHPALEAVDMTMVLIRVAHETDQRWTQPDEIADHWAAVLQTLEPEELRLAQSVTLAVVRMEPEEDPQTGE